MPKAGMYIVASSLPEPERKGLLTIEEVQQLALAALSAEAVLAPRASMINRLGDILAEQTRLVFWTRGDNVMSDNTAVWAEIAHFFASPETALRYLGWHMMWRHHALHNQTRGVQAQDWIRLYQTAPNIIYREWLRGLTTHGLYERRTSLHAARDAYKNCEKLGTHASALVSVLFVDPVDTTYDTEREGCYVVDGCQNVAAINPAVYQALGIPRTKMIILPEAARVAPLSAPDGTIPAQTILVLDSAHFAHEFPGLFLPQQQFLLPEQLAALNLATIEQKRCLIFAQIDLKGHGMWAHERDTVLPDIAANINSRRGFTCGISRQIHYGKGVGVGQRADQAGGTGDYENFLSKSLTDLDKAILNARAHRGLDLVIAIIEGVFPGMVEEERRRTHEADCPPRGVHGIAATAAACSGYTSPQHTEVAGDPRFSFGITLHRPASCPDFMYNFAFPSLNGGKGLIAENIEGTVHLWRSEVYQHGTAISPITPPNSITPDMQTIGMAIYQKQSTLARKHTQRGMEGVKQWAAAEWVAWDEELLTEDHQDQVEHGQMFGMGAPTMYLGN
ncbi:hypothetical protein CALVIDRAFT_564513 [Calocera viscosa TUFC12733]|uniref:Uncharacterized protein n=1 Tax=Calocera viscosa (strain TUFC12733) TaxID=1330018 RepID=A0A167LN16_CALVF|nr:hypothetical protein CALVIDRAFT_564513 [Calocera viscosa TUFC12733]